MEYIFRKARTGDEPALLDLVGASLGPYGLVIDPDGTDLDLTNLESYYFNNNGWFEVIEGESKIIGSYGLLKVSESTCELRKMYLYPKHQGKGLGRKMMDKALAKAKKLGYSEMTLETNSVLDKAIQMYKQYGFQQYHPEHIVDRCDMAMRIRI
jgi:putative acetyltransferase